MSWRRKFSRFSFLRGAFVYLVIISIVILPVSYLTLSKAIQYENQLKKINNDLTQEIETNKSALKDAEDHIKELENEDLRKTNLNLTKEITDLKNSYKSAQTVYEQLLALREKTTKTSTFDSLFASILSYLGKDDLKNTQDSITKLSDAIKKENDRIASLAVIPANVPSASTPPNSGYRRQSISVDNNVFLVDIVTGDLNSTKVIIDTASNSTCTNNCPVMALSDYVSRSGAYAGINGTYFCPDTYPSCADKKNTFDTLVMNKNKVYFNSDNNVYSTVPVAVFSGNTSRFIGQSLNWGRDTGVDAVIANRPMLVSGGNLAFTSGGEAKEVIRGNRSFLGASGSIAYIGVVHNATVAESAKVVWSLGIKDALNLDDGGSVALWSGGYKVGPGRNLPNVVLFVRR